MLSNVSLKNNSIRALSYWERGISQGIPEQAQLHTDADQALLKNPFHVQQVRAKFLPLH